ncbi:MAG: hypothetical protein GXX79_14545 [Actinomycetales bacterium]|nr:hypothetical protein [Actinomycetales bacterium]
MSLAPRVVVAHRRSELDELLDRHGTRGQAEFFLRTRGRDLDDVQRRHDALAEALAEVARAVPAPWRRGAVERTDLSRFRFDPEDLVVVVGQDGLVANVAKYLDGQPVLGVDPEPGRNPGVLVRHAPGEAVSLLPGLAGGAVRLQRRSMVEAATDDGQSLVALNEVFLGHPGHQSARYRISVPGRGGDGGPGPVGERQSSSGVLVGTGTGATGWCASLARERARPPVLPGPEEDRLAWFVREAWPSPVTGTELTAGVLAGDERLRVVVESDPLVVFGDGIEADRLVTGWGQEVRIGLARRRLALVA